jgi:putative heme-binding domain-containing protein
MLAALKQSKSRSSVRADVLRPRLAKYPESVRTQGEALLTSLHVESGTQARHLEELLVALKDGDIRRGQLVFNSQKTACVSCHAMGYLGGKVGPDLTRIGQVRSERDLLEAIVYPSASFARSYEPITVTTTAGATHSGVLKEDLPDEVVLATGPGEEMRIPRQKIADMRPGTVSIMPTGLDEQLTRQELADLVAFLKATRSGA